MKYLIIAWEEQEGHGTWITKWWGTNKREALKQFRAECKNYEEVRLLTVDALAIQRSGW